MVCYPTDSHSYLYEQDCQGLAWKEHCFECKIFASLPPNAILPNTLRLLLRPFLQHHRKPAPYDGWNDFLSLQSHAEDFQSLQSKNADGLTTWQTIELMAQALLKYSAVKESAQDVQGMLARVMTNAHTLVTPTLDPLGLCLDPLTALLNHSCVPNAHITFDGRALSLRSLREIAADEEITISYVDTTNPTSARRNELSSRYFFTCQCPACRSGLTNGQPEMTISLPIQRLVNDAIVLQHQAAALSPLEASTKLEEGMSLLQRDEFPPSHQPYASLLHSTFLSALAAQDWARALKYATLTTRDVEPIQYPLPWHPIRLVRKWVLLRLLVHIATLDAENDETVKVLKKLNINHVLVSQGLWKELRNEVAKSHGDDTRFAREIQTFGEEIGAVASSIRDRELELEWAKVARAADL